MSTRGRVLSLTIGERLVTETCYSCGVLFAMVEDFYDHRQQDRKSFYCPNGHSQAYLSGKTDAQKLEDAHARELALRDQAGAAIRDAEQLRVALLRDRERFANGVCPCCNRSFVAVARHIKDQHPDYDVSEVRQGADRFECSCGGSFETLRGLRIHQGRLRRGDWDRPGNEPWMAHLTEGVKA